jgi:hypothetical protein
VQESTAKDLDAEVAYYEYGRVVFDEYILVE